METKINSDKELKLTYFKNGNIRITPLTKMTMPELFYALNDFDFDVFESNEDGWTYLVSNYNGNIYYLNDYSFNHIDSLLDKKSVIVKKIPANHKKDVQKWYDAEFD